MNFLHALRLRQMVDLHWSSLGRALRNFGVADADLDDALQQAYVVAATKVDAIELGKERAFLLGTCVHVAARLRRAKGRAREIADYDLDAIASDAVPADVQLDAERAREDLARILDALGPELREVFVLYEIEELTMAVIASALDVPPGTVASRLRRAREEFRVLVAKRGRHK
jgi:RNA polymerase sigma-70 factor, ECF subfamily